MDELVFKAALKSVKVPVLVLDQKWHRLFAISGKPENVKAKEVELNELLQLQGKLNQEIKDLQDQCLETKMESIIAAQRGMATRPSRIHVLQQLEVPILFVYGKSDPRIPVELALAQAMEAKHGEILLLEGVAHMSHLEERDYLRPRILNFVNTCYM
jgi:pimeloyl-ACP methyl ester carboxylesterase